MLRYLANGYRRLDVEFPLIVRHNWEIMAVIDGRLAPTFELHEQPPLQTRTIWVFTPESCHGWHSPMGQLYHRMSFHFGSVPQALESFVRARGHWFSRSLSTEEIVRLQQIAAELEPHSRRPTVLSPLVFQARLLDLAVLILGQQSDLQAASLPELSARKVQDALSWYGVHLALRPTVAQVAAAVHVSPAHLRRLFHEVQGCSPKDAFHRARLDKAMELMNGSAAGLDVIAHECGFTSASHLCHDYKARFGITPTAWRRQTIEPYVLPPPLTGTGGEHPATTFTTATA